MKRTLALLTVLCASASPAATDRLLVRALTKAGFDPAAVSCLLLKAGSGEAAIADWERPAEPVPLGSLVKPLLAVAFERYRREAFPESLCRPQDGCWLPAGHGRLGLAQALAESCNVYFARLASRLQPYEVARVAAGLGAPGPPLDANVPALYGRSGRWRIPPLAMIRAYSELAARRNDPAWQPILAGLARAASVGTASGVGRAARTPALAKTGTAPCSHTEEHFRSAVDGYCIALYPADSPRYTMLLQIHGRTGRSAAEAAGAVLAAVFEPRSRSNANK